MYLEQACLLGTGEISTLFHGLLPDVIYFVLTLYKCNEMAIFFSFVLGSSPCFRGGSSLWLTLLKTSNKTIVKKSCLRYSNWCLNSFFSVLKKTQRWWRKKKAIL